jgi:catechol 2,3-dioxygenase-like lactoylglutathione lyase family enzyme
VPDDRAALVGEEVGHMLGASDLVGFVAATDLARAGEFYGITLGLEVVEESPVARAFDAHGTPLRVTLVESFVPQGFTVLGWTVDDIQSTVRALGDRGVGFERFAGMDQDDLGVWTAPSGDLVAWFKDPDGNVLSLTQVRE